MAEAIRYQNLFKYINKYKPKSLMEIGVWKGDHAKQMIEAALRYHHEIKYIGFDLFENITDDIILQEQSKKSKAFFQEVAAKLTKIKGAEVELRVGFTKDTIPQCPQQEIDFIFIDGGHSPETILTDWHNIQKFIHSKTVVIFDDYWEDRTDFGCKGLVDNLDTSWSVAHLNPVDVFPDKRIRMVRVIRKF